MRGISALIVLGLIGPMVGAVESVSLTVVSYDEMAQTVVKHKGKVVLVDFWFDACLPCKKGIPKVLSLDRQFREQGLVTILVNVDEPSDEAVNERVRQFLSAQRSTAIHLQLDARPEVWTKKVGVKTLPALFLFDREGRLLRKWVDDVDYDQVKQRVMMEMQALEK